MVSQGRRRNKRTSSVLVSLYLINGIDSQLGVASDGVNVGIVMKARRGQLGEPGVGRGAGFR